VCSSLRGREPAAVSFTRYRCRVVRDPIGGGAAVNSPPFSKGDVCASRQRDSGGFFSHRSLNAHCAVNPSPSLSPVGSSLRGREPTAESFALFCAESSGSHLRRSRGQQSPFFKGGCLRQQTEGFLWVLLTGGLNAHCAVNPSPSLSPVGSSLRGREPTAESFALF
jgi:hypothetical protein